MQTVFSLQVLITRNAKCSHFFLMRFRLVLSHGELGILYASDHPYKPENLWTHFTADKCPSLAGKPKMFFIQVGTP